jgi:hypothetical protein
MTPPHRYGCHTRKPITTFGKATCQYTYTALGQSDPGCTGCPEKIEVDKPKPKEVTNGDSREKD